MVERLQIYYSLLKAPITTNIVWFYHLPECISSCSNSVDQDQTVKTLWSGSTPFASVFELVNNVSKYIFSRRLQQTSFVRFVFVGALSVNVFYLEGIKVKMGLVAPIMGLCRYSIWYPLNFYHVITCATL